MGGKSGPSNKQLKKQADYQFSLNQRAQQQSLQDNRVSQNSPWGSVNWTQDPNTKQWTQNTTLAPAEQQRLDQQRGMLTGLGNVAQPVIGQVGDALKDRFQLSNIGMKGPSNVPTGPQFSQVGQGPQFQQSAQGPQFSQVGQGPQFNTDFGSIDPNKLAQMGQGQFTGAGAAAGYNPAQGQAAMGQAAQLGQAQQAQGERAALGNLGQANRADFASAGPASTFGGATTTAERAQQTGQQTYLDTRNLSAMPEASEAVRQQVIDSQYQQAMSRLQPQFDQQRQQALDRLYAMGGREGDPMFEQQKANLERNLTDQNQQALWNAINQGGAEQSRLFGLGMAGRQQGFNELLQGGQFTNQALMNEFQQSLANAQMGNQVGMANAANQNQAGIASMNAQNQMNQFNAGQQNQMGMFNAGQSNQFDLSRFGAENQMNQFNAGQMNQLGQFNAGQQNQFGLQQGQFNQQANMANQAAQNQFGLANMDAQNQAGQFNAGQQNAMGMFNAGQANDMSRFNAGQGLQGMLAGMNFNRQGQQMGNEALQQSFANQLAGTGFNNQAAQQGWQNQMRGLEFDNANAQQGWQNQLAGTGFNNAAGQQGFQNQMAQNAEQSRIRNEQIQQQLLERGVPMSELGSVLGMMGQVQNPQFSNFYTQGVQAPDYMSAYMQGQQMQAQGQAGMMSGIGSLAGSLGSAAILASDRRLKKNVSFVGKTAGGNNLYQYEYKFGGPAQVGVMADEVPEAAIDVNGVQFVDYSKVK